MEALIGLGIISMFVVALAVGRKAMLGEAEKRLHEWVRSNGFTLDRCEPTGSTVSNRRPSWRVRVITSSGERREGVVRGGWSIREPVEVTWANPGDSVFR